MPQLLTLGNYDLMQDAMELRECGAKGKGWVARHALEAGTFLSVLLLPSSTLLLGATR